MAAVICQSVSKVPVSSSLALVAFRGLRTTPCALKNIRAAVPKATFNQDKPLTYEQSQYPFKIGVTKSWNSWNSANLTKEGFDGRAAERAFDDIMIRKFMRGTWPELLASEVIVKRRQNVVVVAGLVLQRLTPTKLYFLIGYSEEMLSYLLKCPVKLELQTVFQKSDMIFKKI